MHRYERALRGYVGPGGKFAVQASLASFVSERGGTGGIVKRLWDWNDGLKPEDWFEAVTTHLYPAGTYLLKFPEAKTHEGFFRLMLGRVDSGTERHLEELAKQLPGKEIWVTEWNPQGGNFKDHLPELLTPDVRMHLATRMNLAILSSKGVTRIVHNATDAPRRLDLVSLAPQLPAVAEAVVADKLEDAKVHPARVLPITIQEEVSLPALSMTRLVWNTPGK
jgi:hypothetical protein